MKTCLSLLLTIFIISNLSAQCDNTVQSTYKHDLDDMDISHRPDLTFYSFNDINAGYVLNGNDGVQTPVIFQGGLWMGGLNETGDLKISARAYTDFEDYSAGPLDDGTGGISDDDCINWDQFFQVSAEDINQVIADYEDDGIINEAIPENVLFYPGIGSTAFQDKYGFALPDENMGGLASFVDRDNDGKYDATKGDYPAARGTESVFWVSNDRNSDNDDYVGMEFLVTSSVNTDEVELAFSSQMKVKAIYHGNESLKDFYFGIWMDADLGCITNDMVGCLPDSNLIFYYGTEQITCQEGNPFNEGTQPLLLMKYDMNGGDKMASFISYNRQNISNEPFGTTDPQNSLSVYNGLRGRWRDGESLTYGGEGYNIGSTDVRKFQYNHADNAEPGPWKACEDGQLIRDKRTLVSFGPYNVEPGQIFNLKFSAHLIENSDLGCPSESEILEVCDRIESVITDTKPIIYPTNNFTISPNPFSHVVSVGSGAQSFDQIFIYDLNGKMIYTTRTTETKSLEFDTSRFIEGVYTIQFMHQNSLLGTQKMVKIQ